VETFKKMNPTVGRFRCTCLDGTRVDIKVANNDEPVTKRQRIIGMFTDRPEKARRVKACEHGTKGCTGKGEKHMCPKENPHSKSGIGM
jgi:hypothetical protein